MFAVGDLVEELEAATGPVAELDRRPVVEPCGAGMHDDEADAELLGRPSDSQIEDGMLLLEIRSPDQDGVGRVDIRYEGPIGSGCKEMRSERIVDPDIDVVRAQHHSGELGEGVGVLVGAMSAADHGKSAATVVVPDEADPLRHAVESIRPCRFDQFSVTPHQGRGETGLRAEVLEAETLLVGQPAVIGRVVVHPDQAKDLVLADLDREPGMGRVVKPGALHHLEVPRPGPEPVLGGGERAHRAELDRVAGEVGREREVGEGVDLGDVGPRLELDERITADLVGETGASGAEDAPFAVEEDQVGDGDRLLVVALDLDETTLTRAVRERLVLEWAFTTLVTHRAIEGVIGQKELEDALLCLLHGVVPGVDHHPVGDVVGARRHQHRATRPLHLDQAHSAHPDRVHPLVPAETRDVGSAVLCRLDQQRAGGDSMADTVDGDGYDIGRRLLGHA